MKPEAIQAPDQVLNIDIVPALELVPPDAMIGTGRHGVTVRTERDAGVVS
jgi:hypothetical protein